MDLSPLPWAEDPTPTTACLAILLSNEDIQNNKFDELDDTLCEFSGDFLNPTIGLQNFQFSPSEDSQLNNTDNSPTSEVGFISIEDESNSLGPFSPRQKCKRAIEPGRHRCRYCKTSFTFPGELRQVFYTPVSCDHCLQTRIQAPHSNPHPSPQMPAYQLQACLRNAQRPRPPPCHPKAPGCVWWQTPKILHL